ncbi:MAG: hypothetical protein CO030_01665 [Candidatus Magasanikbacteria bacterium CG_4_9_14_0_2_um_filter_42_11]|nr:MAG: hypothetical protein CO030_01665 [Candidatus Magasanikbacteria bacterium CG_4_9_14_0_2_um_filter_42_11]
MRMKILSLKLQREKKKKKTGCGNKFNKQDTNKYLNLIKRHYQQVQQEKQLRQLAADWTKYSLQVKKSSKEEPSHYLKRNQNKKNVLCGTDCSEK